MTNNVNIIDPTYYMCHHSGFLDVVMLFNSKYYATRRNTSLLHIFKKTFDKGRVKLYGAGTINMGAKRLFTRKKGGEDFFYIDFSKKPFEGQKVIYVGSSDSDVFIGV